MSITRANPNGWSTNDTLTSSQQNQVDTNTTYGLDNRSGQTDTLSSNITIASGGGITFNTGSALLLDPSVVSVSAGILNIGAELNGDNSVSDTLRFGYKTFSTTGGSHTLSNTEYNKFAIKVTGVLSSNSSLTFPTAAGYTKIIDNQTTGAFTMTVGTASQIAGSSGIVIPQGKQIVVYCDGTNLNLGSQSAPNSVVSIQNKHEVTAVGTTVQTMSTSSYVDITGYTFTFTNVIVGDIFEIFYRSASLMTGSGNGDIIVNAAGSLNETGTLAETDFNNPNVAILAAGMSTIITSTGTSNVTIKLQGKCSANTLLVLTPLSFTVKQIRP